MTTFRKGDRVELTVEVVSAFSDDSYHVRVVGTPGPNLNTMYANQLSAGHRAIGVGCRVACSYMAGGDYRVVTIDDGWAWVRRESDGIRLSAPLSDLTPAPEET